MAAATRIAINGFGRIGRCVARVLLAQEWAGVELVAINDLTDAKTLAHLLEFDSVHGRLGQTVKAEGSGLSVGGRQIPILAERDPGKLPWKAMNVDVVLECTGLFTTKEKAGAHVTAGAKRVIISAPGGADVDATLCVGINLESFDPAKHQVISNASCTTNCLAPVAKVIHKTFGIVKGHMVTVHSYTNDQNLLDLPHKDLRRARAAAMSMIPSTTGAAKAIGLVLPELKGKLDGTAIRVPTPNVSLVDLTVRLEKAATKDQINDAYRKAAGAGLKGILQVSDIPLVSCDFNGDLHSATLDAEQTNVIGDLAKVMAWYDNEAAYAQRLFDLAVFVGSKL